MTGSIASTVLAWLLTYAIHSTVLLGLAWVVTRRRRDPATSDILWKAAILGGLVTATMQLQLDVRPTGTMTLPNVAAAAVKAPDNNKAAIRTDLDVGKQLPVAAPADPAQPEANAAPPSSGATTPSAAPSRLKADVVLVAIWAAVAVLLAVGYAARRLILVGRLTERQPLTDGPIPEMLEALRRDVGYRRRVWLTTARTISSPVALGRGEICLPEAALTDLHPELQRSMLAHELAHLSRRDPLWLDTASLIERLFFFQPLNHLARREMQDAAEYLCDDWAARRTGSGIPLARCLAKVAEWIQASPLGVPVAGMAEQRSMLVSRISRLIEGGTPGAPAPRRGAAVVALLALGATIAIAPGVSGRVKERSLDATESEAQADLGPGHGPKLSSAQMARMARDAERAARNVKVDLRGLDVHGLNARVASLADARFGNGDVGQADTTVVNALIARLRDDDAQVRAAAARSLGRLEDARAVPGLITALKDDDAKVRSAAASSLSQFEDPRAIAPLTSLLADANSEVRQQALEGLGNFEKGVSAAPIVRLLDDGDADIRHQAAHLLGRIGDRSTAGALSRMLKDQSADVRQAAIEALGELQEASAGPAILGALGDANADIRQQALQTLEELKVAIPESTLRILLNDGSAEVRGEAAQMVGSRSIVALVPALQKLMQDTNGDVRERAIDALSNMADQSARDALRGALNSSDAKVRRRAAEALGERP